MQSQKPLYQATTLFSSSKNNEAQTLKHNSTVAALQKQGDGNKQSLLDWKLSLDSQPPTLPANKNVNKRRQEENQLGVNFVGVGEDREGRAGMGARGREGCCFLFPLFTSPKRNPRNMSNLSRCQSFAAPIVL